jgi:hypothetical protein
MIGMIATSKDEYEVNAANPFFFGIGKVMCLRTIGNPFEVDIIKEVGVGSRGIGMTGDNYAHLSPLPQPVQPDTGTPEWIDALSSIASIAGLAGLGCGDNLACDCGCNKKDTGGLGEYPGYVCYDANRPSWLPYWLDDLSESTCKLQQVPANITACINPFSTTCAPTNVDQGSYLNLNVVTGTPNFDPNVSGSGIAAAGQPTNTPTVDLSNVTVNPSNIVVWLAVGLGVLVLVKS